jgi:hypothetical protein
LYACFILSIAQLQFVYPACYLSYGETPLVNCGPRSILLHYYYYYHSIRLILCLQQTAEIDNLTVSWGKVLGCVVCRFHVADGAKLGSKRGAIYKLSGAVAKLASINIRKLVLSPTGSINLGFILREDLLMCSSYLTLGVPNWAIIYTPSSGHPHNRDTSDLYCIFVL